MLQHPNGASIGGLQPHNYVPRRTASVRGACPQPRRRRPAQPPGRQPSGRVGGGGFGRALGCVGSLKRTVPDTRAFTKKRLYSVNQSLSCVGSVELEADESLHSETTTNGVDKSPPNRVNQSPVAPGGGGFRRARFSVTSTEREREREREREDSFDAPRVSSARRRSDRWSMPLLVDAASGQTAGSLVKTWSKTLLVKPLLVKPSDRWSKPGQSRLWSNCRIAGQSLVKAASGQTDRRPNCSSGKTDRRSKGASAHVSTPAI